MIKKNVTPKEVVSMLNDLLKKDRRAVESLFNIRVFCNKELSEHKTVQVHQFNKKPDKFYVGVIGILNGIFGIDKKGWGCISIDLSSNNKINQFKLLKPNN